MVVGHTTVVGARRMSIASMDDAITILQRANNTRATEATAMNATSSRSHSVFMMYITGEHEASNTRLMGVLNLVDLAGSERSKIYSVLVISLNIHLNQMMKHI